MAVKCDSVYKPLTLGRLAIRIWCGKVNVEKKAVIIVTCFRQSVFVLAGQPWRRWAPKIRANTSSGTKTRRSGESGICSFKTHGFYSSWGGDCPCRRKRPVGFAVELRPQAGEDDLRWLEGAEVSLSVAKRKGRNRSRLSQELGGDEIALALRGNQRPQSGRAESHLPCSRKTCLDSKGIA